MQEMKELKTESPSMLFASPQTVGTLLPEDQTPLSV
jgi:hypothetical protein